MVGRLYVVLCFLFAGITCTAQRNSRLLDSLVMANPLLKSVVSQKSKFKPQIIFTQINRDANNRPVFTNHSYLLDSTNYFYCASLVKLPCSVFALEKINALNKPGLTRQSPMLTDSAGPCQQRMLVDTSAQNGLPSLEHHIKRMLLVSDNVSYSRVFEFLTPQHIQKRLMQMGHPTARIVHRFDVSCIGKGNRYFNPVSFTDASLKTIYTQPADSLSAEFSAPFDKLVIGKNVYNRRKRLVSSSKDFTKSNYLPLQAVHNFLRDLLFNDFLPPGRQFNLAPGDYEFLIRHLAMYPRESEWPRYNPKVYFDSFKKYFIYGAAQPLIESDTLRIVNIVGRAYGFVSDCAYIVDYRTGTEFMLSAVLYTNRRNSFGSGNYEYDTIGLPFLKELSLDLYRFESNRKKKQQPNLDKLKKITSGS